MNQPPSKPGWRGTGGGRSPAARPKGQSGWRQRDDSSDSAKRRNFLRRIKAAVVTLTALGLAAVVAWILFHFPTKTPLIVVAITKYEAPIPPNAFAYEDLRRFQAAWPTSGSNGPGFIGSLIELFQSSSSSMRVVHSPQQWTQEQEALEAIETQFSARGVRPGGPDKDIVLLYISAHGMLDDRGQPCLVLATPPQLDPSTSGQELSAQRWLPIDKLLARIKQATADRKRSVKTVLLLDCNRFESCWELGVLYNDFAGRLEAAVKQADLQDFAVLVAANPGQTGWAGPELQGSLFGRFVVRGLQGAADTAGNKDKRVSLDELSKYLSAEIVRWSSENLHEIQKPFLILSTDSPPAARFSLAWAQPPNAGNDDDAVSAAPAGWSELEQLWQAHQRLNPWRDASTASPTRDRLLAWQAFQAGLLRCEQLALAGQEYQDEATNLGRRLHLLADDLPRRVLQPNMTAGNLPLLLASQESPPPASSSETIQRLFFADSKPGELTLDAFSYAARASAAWTWAVNRFELEHTDKVLAGVGVPPAQTDLEPVEIAFLRMFSWLPEGVRKDSRFLQKGVQCRDLAERAANVEPRTQYAIRTFIGQGDDRRRSAEDTLFIGRVQELAATEQEWTAANEQYRRGRELGDTLAQAFFVRDRAWNELPYLARWLAECPQLPSPDKGDASWLDQCVEAIQRNHRLNVELDSYLEASLAGEPLPERRESLNRTAAAVDRGRARLQKLLDGIVEKEKDFRAADVKSLRQLRGLLAVPLVTGNRRSVLWSTYRQIAGHAIGLGANQESDTATLQNDRRLPAAQLYNRAHPALALVDSGYLGKRIEELEAQGRDQNADAPLAGNDAAGSAPDPMQRERLVVGQLVDKGIQLRLALRALRDDVHGYLTNAVADPQQLRPEIAVARTSLSWADRRVRATMSLVALPSDDSRSIFFEGLQKLREFDLHHAQTYQASRAIDDFWGSGQPIQEGIGAPEPYFVRAASRYLRSAEKLRPYQSSSLQQATKRFEQESQAARTLVSLQSELILSGDDGSDFRSRLTIQFARGVPTGRAALYALDPAGQPREIKAGADASYQQRLALPTDAPADKRPMCSFRAGAGQGVVSDTKTPWKLVCYYRNHVHDWRLEPPRLEKPREVVFVRPVSGAPRVNVLGYSGDPGCVTFILDCSSSMRLKVDAETTRMEEARTSLITILRQLALAHQYRASIWLYGHRCGVSSADRRPIFNPAYGPVAGVLPSDDVQRIWAAAGGQVLDSDTAKTAIDLLSDQRKVTNWGKTPLYLSICRAVEDDLAFQPKTAPRRLFVITDGQDEPWYPGDNFQPVPENTRTLENVVQTIEREAGGNRAEQVQLYLVGWDLRQRPDLEQLASRVGGKFFNLETPVGEVRREDLLQTLRRNLGLYEYNVVTTDNRQVGPPKMLNEFLNFDDHPAVHGKNAWREYFLSLVDQPRRYPFALEGGESLVWTLARHDGVTPTLEHSRYDFGGEVQRSAKATRLANPNREPADWDFNPPFFYVAAGTPDVRGGDVVFPISIQNDDPTRFSPRPSEMWIEITPLVSNDDREPKRLAPYVFHDFTFEPKYPVPVVHCPASAWPAEADSADIELWFKLRTRETSPVVRKRIQDAQGFDEKPNADLDLKLDDEHKLQFSVRLLPLPNQVGGCQIVVESTQAPDPYAAKVEIIPPPDEIRHSYFLDANIARHAFVYRNATENDARDFEICISKRSDRKRDAIKLRQPVTVRLIRRSN